MTTTLNKKLLDGEIPLKETGVTFVNSFDDAMEFKRWLGESRNRSCVGVDTETSGLSMFQPDSRIRLFQVGDVNQAFVINAEDWSGLCKEFLRDYNDSPMIFHNISFDAKFISSVWKDVKFPWSRCGDTMLMHKLHDSETSAALKTISLDVFGNMAVIGQRALDEAMTTNGWDWNTVPMSCDAYTLYSGMDVILTARLYDRLQHVHSGEFQAAYEIEYEARRICSAMELRGMRIDRERVINRQIELDEYVEKMISFCMETFGVKIGSSKQLGAWFTAQGAPLTEFTATGAPKMDADALEALAGQGYELAQYALNARKATKISGTYLSNMLKFADDNDILHPDINTLAARTGRMSIQNPALQTLPSSDKHVRPSVIPFDGEVLLSADYDQQELRLIAGLSRDENMINAFKQADEVGPDFFTQSAQEIFKDPTIVKSDPRRNITKSYWYSSAYGAGVEKQAQTAGIPVAEMREIVRNVESEYSVMTEWKKSIVSRLETMARSGERPYVTLFDGRRVYVNPDKSYTGVNYVIQGSCAVMMKQSLINLDFAGLGGMMVVPIHDEVLFSVPEHEVDDLRPVIAEAMYNGDFGIDITAAAGESMMRWTKS